MVTSWWFWMLIGISQGYFIRFVQVNVREYRKFIKDYDAWWNDRMGTPSDTKWSL